MRAAVLAAFLALLLAIPGVAGASSLRISPATTLRYVASSGEPNRVVITWVPGQFTVVDPGRRVRPTAPCQAVSRSRATCPDTGITAISMSLRDRDDSANLDGVPVPASISGGDGNDRILGGNAADRLFGSNGNDLLDGRGGGDRYSGGNGTDTVSYAARTAGVIVDLDGNPDDGEPGEGDNVLSNIEAVAGGSGDDHMSAISGDKRLVGGPGNDDLAGGVGNDVLEGGEGDDRLDGRPGNDVLDGGPGVDLVDYLDSFDSVRADLGARQAVTIRGSGTRAVRETDRLLGDENLRGSPLADRLRGDDGPNVLIGGRGGDVLDGGLGPDLLVGGGGRDVADYGGRRQPVTVTLDGQAGDGAPGEGDLVAASTEDVRGGAAGDVLVGNDRGNRLVGGGGSDRLLGAGGNDLLMGGARGDRLDGGDGNDRLGGGPGNDVLTGDAGRDRLLGGTGSDRLDPGPGPDFVFGQAGGDLLSLVDGEVDRAACGPGRDRAIADRADRLRGCEQKTRR